MYDLVRRATFIFADGAKMRADDSGGDYGGELSQSGPSGFHRLRGRIGIDRGSSSGLGADSPIVGFKRVVSEETRGEAAQLRILDHRRGGGGILATEARRGETIARESDLRGGRQVGEEHQGRT